MSNLKPAPLPLTADLAAKLAGERPAFGKGIVHVPIAGIVNGPAEPELPLADRPRRSQLRLPIHPMPHAAGEPESTDG